MSMFKEKYCRGMLRKLPCKAVGVFGNWLFRRDLRDLPRPTRQRDLVVARLARVEHEPRGVGGKHHVGIGIDIDARVLLDRQQLVRTPEPKRLKRLSAREALHALP